MLVKDHFFVFILLKCVSSMETFLNQQISASFELRSFCFSFHCLLILVNDLVPFSRQTHAIGRSLTGKRFLNEFEPVTKILQFSD